MTTRLRHQEHFWNDKARENAQFHIVSDMVMWDETQRDAAFERMGQEAAAAMAPWFAPDMTVLDLGCGMGRVVKHVAPLVRKVIGVDISDEMLERGREFLAALNNVELRKTEGASLPGVPDASLDYLWSILCLIHVDKRSAWQYFEDIHRALKPGGIARLQFHNILAPEGLEQFIQASRLDYPMEFYAPEELKLLLTRAGFQVLQAQFHGKFIDAYVLKGDAEAWRRAARASVVFEHGAIQASREDEPIAFKQPVVWRTKWSNSGPTWRGFRFAFRIVDPAAPLEMGQDVQRGSAVVRLPPGSKGEIEIALAPRGAPLALRSTAGEALISHLEAHRRSVPLAGSSTLLVAFMPVGCDWNAEEAAQWRGASWHRKIAL